MDVNGKILSSQNMVLIVILKYLVIHNILLTFLETLQKCLSLPPGHTCQELCNLSKQTDRDIVQLFIVCFLSDRILIILPRHESLIFINSINQRHRKYFNQAALTQGHMLGSVIERSCLSLEGLNDWETVRQGSCAVAQQKQFSLARELKIEKANIL